MPYVINWDNGNDACGTFTHLGVFDTEAEAERVAEETTREMRAERVWGRNGFCEVYEISEEERHEYEPLPHKEEGTLAHFDRYIAGDR